jgi:predicted O-methyltransferase YrrM
MIENGIDLLIPKELPYLKKLVPEYSIYLSEGLTLSYLASKAQTIVEIGSDRGRSACFMAAGNKKADIFCIDTWDIRPAYIDEGHGFKINYQNAEYRAIFDKQTEPFKERVHPVKSYSVKAALKWKRPIDLLFIDADHGKALEDYTAWYPHVAKGGVIVFHDADMKAVRIAIKQIKRKLQLTGWTTVNRLVYATKK